MFIKILHKNSFLLFGFLITYCRIASEHRDYTDAYCSHAAPVGGQLNKFFSIFLLTVVSVMLFDGSSLAHAASKKTIRPVALSSNKAGRLAKTSVDARRFDMTPRVDQNEALNLRSQSALVLDRESAEVLYSKNTDAVQPIASITKLMTAITVIDTHVDLDEPIKIDMEDMDFLRGTRSRLRVGEVLRRSDLLRLALMASENRAAAALARSHPGGVVDFVTLMNKKAQQLGLKDTRFSDATGLSSANVSTARDLAKLVAAGAAYPLIREYSTTPSLLLTQLDTGHEIEFRNTNLLVRSADWTINVSKTGYINESGQCLVMDAVIDGRALVIVLLDSSGRLSRIGDANRVKKWLETNQRVLSSPRNVGAAT
jgi:serine-type D-Ala-D-Ala endopeptidase (penicillin-binding protein 7)